MSSELHKPVNEINIGTVIKETFQGKDVAVTASRNELKITINGTVRLKRTQSDGILRLVQWLLLGLAPVLALAAEVTMPFLTDGFSFLAVLGVVGSIGVHIRKRLSTSFRTRVIDQIAWAEQMAHGEEEMMLAAIGCFWALRDTRPSLAATFRFWHPNEGSNSVRETMLEPLVIAMDNLAEYRNLKRGNPQMADFNRQNLFDQKLKYVAGRVYDRESTLAHGSKEKEPGLETAWWRTVKIPFWVNELYRNVGVTLALLLFLATIIR
jgi:hypothetical protein